MIVDAGVDGGQSQVRFAIAGRDGVHTADGVAHSDGDTVALVVEGVARGLAGGPGGTATSCGASCSGSPRCRRIR